MTPQELAIWRSGWKACRAALTRAVTRAQDELDRQRRGLRPGSPHWLQKSARHDELDVVLDLLACANPPAEAPPP
jgi:hypothetical protein